MADVQHIPRPPHSDREARPPSLVHQALRQHEAGALIGTSGEQTSLFLAPALIISEDDLEQLLEALDHGLDVADEEGEGSR